MAAEQQFNISRRRFLQGMGVGTAVGLAKIAGVSTLTAQPTAAPAPPLFDVDDEPRIANNLPVPPLAVIALNRLGFGPRPGAVAAFNALGATDDERLEAYADQQLTPHNIPDTALEARLAEANFTTLHKSLAQQWQEHRVADWYTRTMLIRETERAAFIRAIYSQRQLQEVLADFWHNHFNVTAWVWHIAPVFVHYDQEVIRPHMLGNFREMLTAVVQSPAMLYYLNNTDNTRAGPNENLARELIELHTLGAENYLGVMDPDIVQRDSESRPVGYVDEDVYEATRCLTGWTINQTDGSFLYRDEDHDRFRKIVLGHRFPPDQAPLQDGHDLLDLLAYHPGTARHICRKLCRRFVADRPPESLVQSAAAVFMAHQQSPDQLRRVLRHIILSDAFKTTWGQKTKRPFESIVSALRATNADWTFRVNDSDTNNFFWDYQRTGQPLYNWPAPDGYPEVAAAWQGTNALVMRWRLINWLVNEQDSEGRYYLDLVGQTPESQNTAVLLTNYWCNRIFGYTIDGRTRARIRQFMQQNAEPDTPLDIVNNGNLMRRFQMMVAIIMQTPEFNTR